MDDENITTFDATVYTGSEDGTVVTIDVDGGTSEQIWESDVGGTVGVPDDGLLYQSAPTAADGTVYIPSQTEPGSGTTGNLTALDAETGTVEWTFDELNNRVASTPTVHDGTVYVSTSKNNGYDPSGVGHLYGLDAETGTREFAYNRSNNGTGLVGSPTVVERANGSSVGSRVLQGLLGHTDEFPIQTDAELTLTDPTGDTVDGTVTIVDGSGTVTGGQGGRYTLSLDPGTHTVEITAPGFETQQLAVEVSEGKLLERTVALAHAHDVGDVDRDGGLLIVDAVLVQQRLVELRDPG